MKKSLLPCLALIFFCLSAHADDNTVSSKKFPDSAEPYIRPCYAESQKYWDNGAINGSFKGSELYQSCLREKMELLTKDFFSGGKKQQANFLTNFDKMAAEYKTMYDTIYLKNKWCGDWESFKMNCGTMDSMYSYGNLDILYENAVIAIASTIAEKK